MGAYPEADPAIREQISGLPAAIIPVGSTEQHGAHLPVSTDSDIAAAVCSEAGRALNMLVAPTITTGVSFEHAPLFNISIRESTLGLLLGDICDSLSSNGVRDVFVVNAHYGNRSALMKFAEERAGRSPRVHALSYWRFLKSGLDHAGFTETSLMLAVSGGIRMDLARKGLNVEGMPEEDIRRIKVLAASSFPEATGNGIWGDPTGATIAAGRRLLEEAAAGVREEIRGRISGQRPNEILI